MVSRLKDTLLLVGGSDSDRPLMREVFEPIYNLLEAESAAQAAMLLKQNSDCIVAVLADLPPSDKSGIRSLVRACGAETEDEIPLLLLLPGGDSSKEEVAFALGASDVILRPFTNTILRRRVQVLVDLYLHKWHLQQLVNEQSTAIRSTNQVMLDALSAIIEHRSTESGNHVLRIRRFTKILLEEVRRNFPEYNLTENSIDIIAGAAALHDIGKISIPDAILNKPGRLTEAEFEIMKTHTTVGGELIQNLSGMGDTEYLRYAYNIALYHHERWDGNGYPCGLVGDEIPICAQVVSLADVFDALTTPRVYKDAYPYETAVNMILNGDCGKYSSKLLECFKNVRASFVELANRYADGHSPKDDSITMPLPGPNWKSAPLNTTQLSHVKYQALLHYINDTVMELDLDHELYHVVYNPNPDLDAMLPHADFDGILTHLGHGGVHPDDIAVLSEIRRFLYTDFFRLKLRRKVFPLRLFSPSVGSFLPYELIFLRINTGNDEQRLVIAVWHCADQPHLTHSVLSESGLHGSPALYGLVSSALRCHCDYHLTIDAGSRDLFHLTGYSEEEIRQSFDNKLLDLVYSEDRDGFADTMQEHLKQGGRTETEFRLLRKDQPPLWVLLRSRVYIESDGQEYYYLALRDNARIKSVEQQLKTAIERNQIIVDQSGGIVFEWDLLSDTMYCSDKWEKHFGYTPISRNYGTQMGIATHFHPDDLPTVRKAIEDLKSDRSTIDIEVRIANADAKYLWTRITATTYLDEERRPIRIVGLLQDVDALKRAELTLRERAERDALTKLLNKGSTQQLISDYLSDRETHGLAALLILDLDNFKAVNDHYGHLYGDSILSQVGNTLKQLFRAHDIIGRIGGDEFLILMQDIPNTDLVHGRCELLLTTFRTMLESSLPGLNVTCSIGVSLIPAHGVSYNDLFRRADEALYLSKSAGKNTYTVYDPLEPPALVPGGTTRPITRIDSDEQPGMADSSFVHFVFRRLYESHDILATIDELLAYVGQQLGVSRAYIFENNEDNTCCSNTFEWCSEGISPEIGNLQNVSYITDIPGWPDVYDERGVLYCPDITTLAPPFRAILEPQNIKSMLQCAILDGGVFRGYIGFDECTVNRLWTQDQIDLLQFLAQVMALFLLKKRTQDKEAAHGENLRSVLDRQDAWIYVIDPDTFQLKFLNAKTLQLAPDTRPGDICYKAFLNRSSRCKNCPAAHIRQEKTASAIVHNPKFDLRVRSQATLIPWNEEEVCLITCTNTEEELTCAP